MEEKTEIKKYEESLITKINAISNENELKAFRTWANGEKDTKQKELNAKEIELESDPKYKKLRVTESDKYSEYNNKDRKLRVKKSSYITQEIEKYEVQLKKAEIPKRNIPELMDSFTKNLNRELYIKIDKLVESERQIANKTRNEREEYNDLKLDLIRQQIEILTINLKKRSHWRTDVEKCLYAKQCKIMDEIWDRRAKKREEKETMTKKTTTFTIEQKDTYRKNGEELAKKLADKFKGDSA